MLAVGIVATLVALAAALFVLAIRPAFDRRPMILGLGASVLPVGAGVAVALFGLAWQLRILFRGRRGDEPPAWRYRAGR